VINISPFKRSTKRSLMHSLNTTTKLQKVITLVGKLLKPIWVLISFSALVVPATAVGKTIIHEERSLYTSILVQQSRGLLCLNFTLKRADSSQSCMDVKNPKRMVFSYTRMVMAGLLFNPNPKNIMIVGLGGGTLPMALNELFPQAKIQTVEIDGAVVDVAKRFFNFQESANNKIVQQDARVFAKRANLKKEKFDFIILDAFNGDYIPEHLMTREFLTEVQIRLHQAYSMTTNPTHMLTYSANSLTSRAVIQATELLLFPRVQSVRSNAIRYPSKLSTLRLKN